MELLIMAAGMGSRFGGLKQVAPMGPNDEFIIDYSIFDAVEMGFDKVVFVIKEENYKIFKETIGSRVEPHIKVEYVFQKLEDIPEYVKIPEDRVKPWGTGHAILAAKKAIDDDFVVINADDFYGRDAFRVAAEFIKNNPNNEYATVGYEASKTMTENGSVKRGILEQKDGYLTNIVESSIIREDDNRIKCSPLNGSKEFYIEDNDLVSMNMLVLRPSIFGYLEDKMDEFFKNSKDLSSAEFLIPDVLNDAKDEGFTKIRVLHTDATWYGVTYKEDTEYVRNSIKRLVKNDEYPNNLWG